MSTVLEDPRQLAIPDPTAGLELVTGDEVALEAVRHLFLAANLLDPARQRDIALPNGGEEIGSPCLRRTAGKLPRCEITPVEMWVEWMPLELFPQGTEHLALKIKGVDYEAGGRIFPQLYGYPTYPAHAAVDIIGIASGQRRGIVEIENLRGLPYGKEDREMQALFFPADYDLPIPLRLIAERIEKVAAGVADPDVKDTAGFMLHSVVQSGEYMQARVSKSLTRLAERKSGDYFHSLNPKDRSFMAQLEIREPAVNQIQATAEQAVATLPPEVLEQLAQNNAALVNLGPALAAAIGDAVREAVAAATSKPSATKKAE